MQCQCLMVQMLALVLPVLSLDCDATGMLQSSSARPKQDTAWPRDADQKNMVFYNLYVGDVEDIPVVSDFVKAQLSHLDAARHSLRIHSIGAIQKTSELELEPQLAALAETTELIHHDEAQENSTLHDLWSYCRDPKVSSEVVVYLHSKGSFHPHQYQAEKREYMTIGAVSKECTNMPEMCNVCSSRMSPFPTPHTPGNMWAARCSYISKLIDPLLFEDAMDMFVAKHHDSQCADSDDSCRGLKRFSNEHWVYSHFDARPCDLDSSHSYFWGSPGEKNLQAVVDFVSLAPARVLQPAPRFDFKSYRRTCRPCGENMTHLLEEYKELYKEDKEPPSTWWGWKFFKSQDDWKLPDWK
mmetsp:Transcript_12860/g.22311  ORF Transcript_12860/g.22311 Transcript_12860/m.22311 type:complete len:355 (+) Transcript_12860:48-1112(+)